MRRRVPLREGELDVVLLCSPGTVANSHQRPDSPDLLIIKVVSGLINDATHDVVLVIN